MCSDKRSERNVDNGFERNIMQKDVNNGLVLTGNVVINAGGENTTSGKKTTKVIKIPDEISNIPGMEKVISVLNKIGALYENNNTVNEIINNNRVFDSITDRRSREIDEIEEQRRKQREIGRQRTEITNNQSKITKINIPKTNTSVTEIQQRYEPLIKTKFQKIVDEDNKRTEKMLKRADVIYGSDDEYYKKYFNEIKSKKYNFFELPKKGLEVSLEQSKEFSDNKTLADMPVERKYDLTKVKSIDDVKAEMEKYNREIKKYINEINNTTIEIPKIGKVKLGDIVPDIGRYFFLGSVADSIIALLNDIIILKKVAPSFLKAMEKIELKNTLISEKLKGYLKPYSQILVECIATDFCDYQRLQKFNLPDTKDLKNKGIIPEAIDEITEEEWEDIIENYLHGTIVSQIGASLIGPDAAGMLRLQGKDADFDIIYTRNAQVYNSPEELPEKYKEVVVNKLKQQKLSVGSKGFVFNSKSNISHSIVKSKEFNDVIMNNIGDLISDKELSTSISYKGNNRNLYYAIGKADIINLKIDNSFNITGDLIDTTDYNAGDNRPIVKAAEKLQKSGIIEPRFLVVNFSIPLIAILFSNFKIKNTKKGNEN